uniref:Uncharacterized protein n=1 Tax=Anguilla anguilla TaxID=7936 RepID=A0A0E9U4V4_ANGAN
MSLYVHFKFLIEINLPLNDFNLLPTYGTMGISLEQEALCII